MSEPPVVVEPRPRSTRPRTSSSSAATAACRSSSTAATSAWSRAPTCSPPSTRRRRTERGVAVRALAKVNLGAIERNVARLAREAPSAALCAVVKADGYGHGMVPCARAALAGGATWLAVATALEARALRAGLRRRTRRDPRPRRAERRGAADRAGRRRRRRGLDVERAQELAARRPPGARARQARHAASGAWARARREEADAVVAAVAAAEHLELAGAWTHFATADERGDAFFGEQLARFRPGPSRCAPRTPGVLLHAANSRGDAARRRLALRPRPPRRRDLRPGPVRRGPGRARAGARAGADVLRRGAQDGRSRATAPATAAAGSRPRRRSWRPSRSATATATAAR